jgi:hypothetical protein
MCGTFRFFVGSSSEGLGFADARFALSRRKSPRLSGMRGRFDPGATLGYPVPHQGRQNGMFMNTSIGKEDYAWDVSWQFFSQLR